MIKQITITLPNEPGELSKISDLMGSEGLNIRAIHVEDRGKNSVLRYIVEDPGKASNLLDSHKYDYRVDEVIAVEVPDHPGALGAILKPLKEHQLNVSYMYPAIGRHGSNGIVIFATDKMEETVKYLEQNYFQVLGEEFYQL